MLISQSLIEDLVRHEGLRLKPYKDTVGKWTIGVGRNLTDKGISEDEAMLMLENDVIEVMEDPRIQEIIEPLDKIRGEVILNMAFNLGVMGFLKFKKMIACLKKKDFYGAAMQGLQSKWATQVKGRATELMLRLETGERNDTESG